MANATATQLQQLYVAYFGRAADPTGLDYWVGQGTTTKSFAASMYAQDEFEAVNGSLSIELQVNQIYQNLFGRDGDTAGLTYWSNQIRTGALELASIANDLIYAVNNGSSATDLTALTNKTNAAVSYTEDIRESSSAFLAYQPKSTSPWVTGTNFETAKTFFKTVTSTNAPSASEVQANVDVIGANGSNTAGSDTAFTLTTGVDEPTTTYTKFDGSLTSGGTQTLGSLDKISGTTGSSDVLNATIKSSVTPASITGIETINVVANAAATLGLVNASGFNKVNAGGAAGALTISGLPTTTTVSISDTSVDHTLSFKEVSGSSDSATISFAQVTGGATTEINIAGIETITATSSGGSASNSFELEAAALTTIVLDGSGDLTLSSLATGGTTKLKSVDASGMTGALDLTTGALALGTSVLTVTGGSGNDSIDSSGQTGTAVSIDGGAGNDTVTHVLAIDDTIDGGTGTDNLITTAVITSEGNVSGFETFTLDVTDAVLNQDFDNLSGNTFTKLVATGNGGTTDDGTFTDVPSTITDLELASTASGDFVVDRKTDTSSDALTVTLKGDTTAILTANHEEELTLVSSTGASTITTLNASDATKLTVTGSANTTVTSVSGNDNLATIDASASTGAVSIGDTANGSVVPMTITAGSGGFTGSGGTKADTFTGGAGDDSIDGDAGADSLVGGAGDDDLDGGAGNDVISGGTGNDTLTSDTGNDNIDGGAGNDTFTLGENFTTDDTIVGGAGTDTLTMTSGGTTTYTAASVSGVEKFTLTGKASATTTDFKNLTGVTEVTFANGSDLAHTVQGLNSGVTVNILENSKAATIDTADAASVFIDVEVSKANGSVTVTDTAAVTVTGKIGTGDIVALALDAIDTTSLSLATTSTNDLDTGAITETDKLTTLNLTTADHDGTITVGTIVDGSSIETITATGVGGNITTDTLFGTDNANNLSVINATATVGSTITFGSITADTTDSPTDNAMVITTSATGVDSGDGNSSVVFDFINNQYGTITLNASGDTTDGTTTGKLSAIDVTATSTGGDLTIANVDAEEDFTLTVTGGTATVTTFDAETFASIDASATDGKLTVSGTASDGNITVLGGSAGDAITLATAPATDKVHSISGGAGNDTITGSSGGDTIVGGDGADSLDGAAGNDNISGGAGNDTFSFMTSAELNADDTIDGGAGTDNLDITTAVDLADSATGDTSVTLTSIEGVDITMGADSLTFDASGWTSLETISFTSATNDYTPTVNNIRDGVVATFSNLNIDDAVLDMATGASITVDVESAIHDLTITDAVNVTINGEGATADLTSLTLDATDTKTLTLTADDGTSLDTGSITNTDEITTITATTTKASGTITMGGGTMVDVDGLTTLNLSATNASLTIGALGTDATANNAELLSTITATATGSGVVLTTGALYADSTVDSTSDLAMTLNLTTNVGARNNIGAIDNTYGSITSTIVSNSDNDTDIGNLTSVSQTHTVSGGGDTDFAAITASGAVTVTSTGSGDLTITDANIDGTSASLSVDASGMTGTTNIDAGNTSVATTLTGGSGADTLKGGSVADTITGGAGADTLETNAGDDTVDGGAGNDTITGGTGDNVLTGGAGDDSITAGAGFDSINAGAGDDTIVLAANISLSDSVDGGAGNDTITATISKGSTGQKIGTMSNVEVATLIFDQTAGSFDASGLTTINLTTTGDTDDVDIDNLTSSMTLNIKDGADDINLDYADDATATINLEVASTNNVDDDLLIHDAQTVNITQKSGVDVTIAADLVLDATDTDYLTVTANVAGSGLVVSGLVSGANVQTVNLSSTSTNAPISVAGTFLTSAAELTSLTLSATSGDNTSPVSIGHLGETAAANKLTTIDLDASHAADVTTGNISAPGATITTFTADATTSGSIITTKTLDFASVSNITTSAVSGAEVDLEGNVKVSTVGTIKHTGAGHFRMDSANNAIVTLERLDLTEATGTNAVDLAGSTNAVTINLGTGADTIILSGAADDVNLSSTASVDTLEYTESTSTTAIAVVSNFAFGSSGGDKINIDRSDMEATSAHTGSRETDLVMGNTTAMATGNALVTEVSGATTTAAGTDVLVFTRTTYANTAVLVTAVEGGDDAITTNTKWTNNDATLAFYSDGTDMYLAMITYISAGATASAWDSGDSCEAKNLMKFEGVTSISSGDIATGDVVIV